MLAACSIQPDAAPTDLPAERADVFGEPATGDEAYRQAAAVAAIDERRRTTARPKLRARLWIEAADPAWQCNN